MTEGLKLTSTPLLTTTATTLRSQRAPRELPSLLHDSSHVIQQRAGQSALGSTRTAPLSAELAKIAYALSAVLTLRSRFRGV